MKIISHGDYHSDKKVHVDLLGKCTICGCTFETFVDIYYDAPGKDCISFIRDFDKTDIKIDPNFVYGGDIWVDDDSYVRRTITRKLESAHCSCHCPECNADVELIGSIGEKK